MQRRERDHHRRAARPKVAAILAAVDMSNIPAEAGLKS
jgi:hypothetical protein